MPELPDVEDYVAALRTRVADARLERVRITGVSLLRTARPPVEAVEGRLVEGVHRVGKRLVLSLEDGLHLVLHLMIAGRLSWRGHGARPPARIGLAALDFADHTGGPVGALVVTEAGTARRASLHLAVGDEGLAAHDRGGLEPIGSDPVEFRARLLAESRTLKRALTDPRRFAGIGNAYSDEILHAAGLSPVQLTTRLSGEEITRLHRATDEVLRHWVAHLRSATGDGFPAKVTAFRQGMAVHGRFGESCPSCGAPVQRIRYARNETNYCPGCQTGGRILADRSLSRLLRDDWPRTLDELEGA